MRYAFAIGFSAAALICATAAAAQGLPPAWDGRRAPPSAFCEGRYNSCVGVRYIGGYQPAKDMVSFCSNLLAKCRKTSCWPERQRDESLTQTCGLIR